MTLNRSLDIATACVVLGDCNAQEKGQTKERVVSDFGESVATAGLTFVFIGRNNWLMDLLIEPSMPFDKLSILGET